MITDTPTTTLNQVTLFIEALSNKDEEAVWAQMHQSPEEYARLLISMGALVTKAAGNLNKLYELVTTLELDAKYDKEEVVLCHVKHGYGADIIVKNRETLEEQCGIEVKHSMTVAKNHYKTNWNFTVESRELLAYKRDPTTERLGLIIGSLYKKQANGITCLVARTGTELLQSYEVSGCFIALYCARKLIVSINKVVNLGCDRCGVCGHYHRVHHLQKWAKTLDERITASGRPFEYRFDYFTNMEWLAILNTRVKAQCA